MTKIEGSRVGIVGGSIGGCAAAIALSRIGCHVTVFERSSGALRDRGSGIAIPRPLRDELKSAGYLPADYPTFDMTARRFVVADGTPTGKVCWVQPGDAVTNNWGVLWRGLRDALPDSVDYRDGVSVTCVDTSADSVTLNVDGVTSEFDAVIGADGYRSQLRRMLHPESQPNYAGYVLWRGNFPASRLSDTAVWDEVVRTGEWLTVGFEGGHGVMYPIPDFGDDSDRLRVNWAIYAPTPIGLDIAEPSSIPPGHVDPAAFAQYEQLLAEHFPPAVRQLFTSPADEVSIQPIYDELVDSYTSGRIALIGDAATLARPHTGSGATKALQDARLLESLGAAHDEWETLLAAYVDDRTPAGRALVELGRRIGRDKVERTPAWRDMSPDDFDAWAKGSLDGAQLYFWDSER